MTDDKIPHFSQSVSNGVSVICKDGEPLLAKDIVRELNLATRNYRALQAQMEDHLREQQMLLYTVIHSHAQNKVTLTEQDFTNLPNQAKAVQENHPDGSGFTITVVDAGGDNAD